MSKEEKVQHLRELYRNASRHSQYQIMPDFLADLVDPKQLDKKWDRFEKERMEYFTRSIDFKNARVADIGANTGYFAFEVLKAGAKEAICYEGDPAHVDFIRTAADIFNKNVLAKEVFMDFKQPIEEAPFEIIILVNVLHHIGFDFGEKDITIEHAKRKIIENLNWFADKTGYMIFQIGFSWMTDYSKPLFPNGTKGEMIAMIKEGIKGYWDVVEIGIAQVKDGITRYEAVNERNIQRDDTLGEFRNRPVFILKSLRRTP